MMSEDMKYIVIILIMFGVIFEICLVSIALNISAVRKMIEKEQRKKERY